MRFTELTRKEFEKHTSENLSHFTQMLENYDEKTGQGVETYLVGVKDSKEEVVASCLVTLNRAMRIFKFANTNRGPVMDFNNKEVFDTFFDGLEKFLKNKRVMYIKVDPYEVYQKRNHDGVITEVMDTEHIFEGFKSKGYEHGGFTVGIDINVQLRFLSILEVEGKDELSLLNDMDGLRKRNIKKAIKNGMQIRFLEEDEMHIMLDLLNQTADKKDFELREDDFYRMRKKSYGDKVLLPLIYIDLDDYKAAMDKEVKAMEKNIAKAEKELEKTNNVDKVQNKLSNFREQLSKLQDKYDEAELLREQHGQILNLSSGLFVENDHELVYLVGGTANDYRHFAGSYLLQWEMIKYTLEKGLPRYNFYGISGDFSEDSEDIGVIKFKKGFNADVHEFVGDFVKPINKPLYKLYQEIRKRRS